ncbi:MAG: hypothetical protein M3136_06065 [Thermoproteota archaeon]|nr:hypothetical protein [Thermoproteota archaeon]
MLTDTKDNKFDQQYPVTTGVKGDGGGSSHPYQMRYNGRRAYVCIWMYIYLVHRFFYCCSPFFIVIPTSRRQV